MTKNTTALFTTRADKALPLWEGNVDHIYFYKEKLPETFPAISEVYFRDPFNEPSLPISDDEIDQAAQRFFFDNPEAYSLDGIHSIDDYYVEDKYRQFQEFGIDFMPETWLASGHEFLPQEHVFKKRISCRCRDVHFERPDGVNLEDYIVQERRKIREEMRVFYLRGEVLRVAETRSSKTEGQKVKVTGYRDLTDREIEFLKSAMAQMPELDFVGIDLAVQENGELMIIEVNRSPQFAGYYKVTGINLAEKVFRKSRELNVVRSVLDKNVNL